MESECAPLFFRDGTALLHLIDQPDDVVGRVVVVFKSPHYLDGGQRPAPEVLALMAAGYSLTVSEPCHW